MRGLYKTKNDTGNGKKRQIQETLQKHGRKKKHRTRTKNGRKRQNDIIIYIYRKRKPTEKQRNK